MQCYKQKNIGFIIIHISTDFCIHDTERKSRFFYVKLLFGLRHYLFYQLRKLRDFIIIIKNYSLAFKMYCFTTVVDVVYEIRGQPIGVSVF